MVYIKISDKTEDYSHIPILPLAADVRNSDRIEEIFRLHKPEVVFHAAAYKHVPLMENLNCWEAVRNNVLGTLLIAQAAIRHGTDKFVLISSDKAVNPTNVMGATKRMAEMICQGLHSGGTTHLLVVRFGNVLGSTGSVIPKFREQIAKGGPVTVTIPTVILCSFRRPLNWFYRRGSWGGGGKSLCSRWAHQLKLWTSPRKLFDFRGLPTTR